MRLDKFLWWARLHPTRSDATEACRTSKVLLNGREAKASSEVRIGDQVAVKRVPIWRSYEVLDLPKSRVGAKLVVGLLRETTSLQDLEKLEIARLARSNYLGDGRPTKRDRRDLERFQGE